MTKKQIKTWMCNHCVSSALAFVVLACPATAQLPASQFEEIFPAGGAANSTVEVSILGNNLDETDKLWFSHPGITSKQKLSERNPFDETALPLENTFLVTIAANVPAGRYETRSHGKYGLSNPRSFMVGSVGDVSEVEPNGGNDIPVWSEVDEGENKKVLTNPASELTLPATVNGKSNTAADVDWFRFEGTAKARLLINGFAKRIDSKIDLSITLYNADGSIVAESRIGAGSDPLIDAILPTDGVYFVKIHDALYRTGTGFYYRFSIGSQPHIDFIFPPAGELGTNNKYTVYGCNLPGGVRTDLKVDGYPLEKVETQIAVSANGTDKLVFPSLLGPHQGGMDGFEFRIGKGKDRSNPLLMTVATAPVVLEQDNNDRAEDPQKLSPPCEVAGKFYPQRDADWFSFEAKKDETWILDVISQRLGLQTDASLLVQRVSVDDKGETNITDVKFLDDVQETNTNNRVGRHEFDYRTTDPTFLLKAPEDGTYRILLRDGHSSVKTDPRLLYRFAVRRPDPDFRIVAVPGNSSGSMLLRRGGRAIVRLYAFRHDGFDGEIQVTCDGLPKGVTTEPVTIGPGNSKGTLILSTSDDAPPATNSLTFKATAVVDGKTLTRNARYGNVVETFQFSQPNSTLPSAMSRVVEGIQVCVTDYDPAPMRLTIGDGKSMKTARGGKLKIPYQVKKTKGATSNLNGFVLDSPPQTGAPQVTIGANEKGEFEMTFRATTPPGVYTVYLAGYNQGYSYARNPEMAEAATSRQERVAEIFAKSQKDLQEKQAESRKRATEVLTATNKLTQEKSKSKAAVTAVTTTQTAADKSSADLKQKQDAFSSNQEDESLKTQVAQSKTAAEQAQQKLVNAKQSAGQAMKEVADTENSLKAVQEAKINADKALEVATEFQKMAQQEKQRADQFASKKKSESNPRNINFHVPSNSLTITIDEFPVEIGVLTDKLTVKQGEKIEVPIKLTRLYDFAENVTVQTQIPGGVSGVSGQSITIPANKDELKFEITVLDNATVGTHDCTVRLQMNFNGQNLTMERPLSFTVVEVKKEK